MKSFPRLTPIRVGIGLMTVSLLSELVKANVGLRYGNVGSDPHWVPPAPPQGVEALLLNFPIFLSLFFPGCALLLFGLWRGSQADNKASSRDMVVYVGLGPAIGALTVLVTGCIYRLSQGGVVAATRELQTFPLVLLFGYALGFLPALIAGLWITTDRKRPPSFSSALCRGAVVSSLYGAALVSAVPRQRLLDFFLFFFLPGLVATSLCWWITQRKPQVTLSPK